MSHSRRRLLNELLKLVDLSNMIGTFGLLAWLDGNFDQKLTVGNFILFMIMSLAWYLLFQAAGLYASQRLLSRHSETFKVLGATTLGSLTILLCGHIFRVGLITSEVDRLGFIIPFWLVSTAAIISSRLAIRTFLEWARLHGRNLRHVLIIGTNSRAVQFAEMIEAQPKLGYRIVGFVDDDWGGPTSFHQSGRKLVADFKGLRRYLGKHVVDEVINTLPFRASLEQSARIVNICQEQGVPVRFLTPIFRVRLDRARVESFLGEPVIVFPNRLQEDARQVAKRLLDLLVSSLLLLALAPLFLIVAVAIRVSSPGKIFFTQERMGLNKRRFKLFKFRTMVENAERQLKDLQHLNEAEGPVFKIKNDPRITPLGAFLRKTSIDELPQLINVFLGDMSLVGPRPLPVRDFEGFDQDWHRRRFSVRPGITCLWQVGGRSDIPFERWMALDMEYIDSWSLWLDFKILMRTIPVVLTGHGAA